MDSAVAGGRIDEGDLIRHSDESDSDSHSKWKSRVKSMFWYEFPLSDDVPDYRNLLYPWEEEKNKKEGKEVMSGTRKKSRAKATGTPWSDYSRSSHLFAAKDVVFGRSVQEAAMDITWLLPAELVGEEEEDHYDDWIERRRSRRRWKRRRQMLKSKWKALEEWMQVREGTFFLKVKDVTWSGLSDKERKQGRWKEVMDVMQSGSSGDQRKGPQLEAAQRMVTSKSTAASLSLVGDLDVEGGLDAQQQSVCTSTEVLDVRMEMHKCFEQGKSYRHLFKSMANRDELSPPELNDMDPNVSSKWLRPTTIEGDKQYLEFFPQLVQAAEYGETKDHVLAKAIVIARKSFQKILRFQIDIAVDDCMDFLRIEEAMKRRYNLYYFAVSEIVLDDKDFESVVKSIRNGESGLPYDLTEFGSSMYLCKAKSTEIVHYLVRHFTSERNFGKYKELSCKEADVQVAQIVCDMVDAQIPSLCHLYQQFLWKKVFAAQELGLARP